MTSLMVTIFIGMLDQTIVAVAMPGIQKELGHFEILPWVMSGYLLAFAVMTPIVGKLSDIYGRRPVLFIAHAIFAASSLICALAPSTAVLIMGRILQGAGGAGLVISSQAIIADIVTPRERGRYMAYISSMAALASGGGPALGGLLTAYFSWRGIFWLNLPLCAVAVAASYSALQTVPHVRLHRKIDYIGGALLSLTIALVLLLFTRIGQGASFRQWDMFALTVGFCGAAAICYLYERQVDDPILPVSFFSRGTIRRGWLIAFLVTAVYIGMTVLIPLQMKIALGLNVRDAAVRLIPFSLAAPLGSYLVGQLMARTGNTRVSRICGATTAFFGILAYSLSDLQDVAICSLAMMTMGIGIGFLYPSILVSLQSEVEARDMGLITASVALFRTIGGALGVAALSALLLVLIGPGIPIDGSASSAPPSPLVQDFSARQIDHTFLVLHYCVAVAMGIVVMLTLGMRETTLRGRDPVRNADAPA